MHIFPFNRKIDVKQNISEGMERKTVDTKISMDELVIQLLIEQNASIARMEHNTMMIAQMLQKFAIAATPGEGGNNG